jgi:hypothetical protein
MVMEKTKFYSGEKSVRMRWAAHVARMIERRGAYTVLVGRSEGKRPLQNLGVDGCVILKWILKKWNGEAWTGFFWLRIGKGGGIL